MRVVNAALALLCCLHITSVSGFAVRPAARLNTQSVAARSRLFRHPPPKRSRICKQPSLVTRRMYNLPSGGGGGGGGNDFKDLLVSVLGVVGLVAFFASPLGGLFFALFNSFLALIFLAPILLLVGFQGWQFFNTIQGPCPNCGASLRVLKDSSPSICLNCGTLVQASADKNSIDVCSTGGTDTFQGNDPFMGGFFDDSWGVSRGPQSPQQKQDQQRRENTVIDVIDVDIEENE